MDFYKFENRWLGKSIDWDGQFGPQCVDEVAQYCAENSKPVAYANAKDWLHHPALSGAFDSIDNNPNDLNQVPKQGDIIIWSGNLPGSGGYGHIAIYDLLLSPGKFQSLDQNWGGQTVHLVQHTFDYVAGWLTPKKAPAPIPAPAPHVDPAPANPPDPAPDLTPTVLPELTNNVPIVDITPPPSPEPLAPPPTPVTTPPEPAGQGTLVKIILAILAVIGALIAYLIR